MPILPFKNLEHIVFEHKTEGRLIAIEKTESKRVGVFFKANKGKTSKPSDTIKGHWFMMDEKYNSLKIDFSKEVEVEIKELELFPLK
jgi:phosphopentomutase